MTNKELRTYLEQFPDDVFIFTWGGHIPLTERNIEDYIYYDEEKNEIHI